MDSENDQRRFLCGCGNRNPYTSRQRHFRDLQKNGVRFTLARCDAVRVGLAGVIAGGVRERT